METLLHGKLLASIACAERCILNQWYLANFQIIHIHSTVIDSGRANTTQHHTHCGLWLRLQSWLMLQSPHRLRNDLKCVDWDVKPCSIQSNSQLDLHLLTSKSNQFFYIPSCTYVVNLVKVTIAVCKICVTRCSFDHIFVSL